MTRLTFPLANHHKHCDDLFAQAEERAYAGDWDGCTESFNCFRDELEAHFSAEEQRLFPAFEGATGSIGGPTQMMRLEHAQMRELLAEMVSALRRRDAAAFSGGAETLLILMQQHNMKEENILYPMCDRTLQGQSINLEAALRERLEMA
ncbi:MAG: hemerythrin domain-containing protein [Rhodocyclaceae bacterium]|nr:hemerythrin domain-containing protein [Rhodocyclaceae bacterium]